MSSNEFITGNGEIMDKVMNIFYKNNLAPGRMVAGSKSKYCNKYPDNRVWFNANIFIAEKGKIWYGDIDLTVDSGVLQNIATSLGTSLYVLREMDGRFENTDRKDFADVAVATFNP